MPLIDDETRPRVADLLSKRMKDEVKLVVFTQEFECDYCRENRELMEELASLSDKVKVEVYDMARDADRAREFGVANIPATVVDGNRNVRYFGVPSGYEFSSLLDDLIDASRRATDLSPASRERLKAISKPVHIQVFVTPTCPYCPRAVRLAHQFAMENPAIRADMVEATEFPHMANRYGVMAVPKVVINETVSFEGAYPEAAFLDQVFLALQQPPTS
ncbi:MAG: thioredoxin family protein [Nitrososphaerota archaeon]|nr:thioredoxin family protein [Nitrososphaerota archaeon]MDG6938832.1 thioredoxin family protein [Nitrososphaerota archaeon]